MTLYHSPWARSSRSALVVLLTLALIGLSGCASSHGPQILTRGAILDSLTFEPLEFRPPRAEEITLSNGLTVFFIEDRSLPLVNLFALFRGGPSHFERGDLAALTALGSSLPLYGGSSRLPPDSVERLIEDHALAFTFSSGGSATMIGVETLTRNLDLAAELWVDALRDPRFDQERVETWRLRQLEAIRREGESPGSIAITEFNHLLFGDHPIGWQLDEDDLRPENLSPHHLSRIHQAIFCTENLTLGATGDITIEEVTTRLEALFGDWPSCPEPLASPPIPRLQGEGGVHIVQREFNQSSLVIGQPGGILQRDHPEYFAAQVANFILGGGGLSSRLTTRIRTEEGLAYSAGSVWGAATRHERIFGAFAQARGSATVAAVEMIREVIQTALEEPPGTDEVELAIDYTVNGFVFAFENPAQIVTRQMGYRLAGLPDDWLERYLAGIQRVTPDQVHEVLTRYIDPDRWTIVIVGDTTLFDAPAGTLGPGIRR